MDAIEQEGFIEVAGLRLDLRTQRLALNGRTIDLRPKSWELLKYMARRPGQLLTKDKLMGAVWAGSVVTDASLNQAVRELRKALGDDARSPRYIETVHRRGFRFIAGSQEQISSSQPNASALPHLGPQQLFGRNQEIARLQELLDLAAAGHRQLCFVTGEPGIGKTRLVQEFLDTLPAQVNGATPLVGWGRCIDQHGGGEAYLPILEALDRLARGPMGDTVQKSLRRYAPLWLLQMPWLLPPDHVYDAELVGSTPARMLREFCVFLESLAADTPLILWLEDLHWCDKATIDLLDAMARREELARVLVVASYRPVDAAVLDAPVRQLKLSLVQHRRAAELALELLDAETVGELLAARFPGMSALAELTSLVQQASDGNPLFVVTLADYLVAHQLLIQQGGVWLVTAPIETIRVEIPNSLKDIIELQLQQASAQEVSLLETASVVGTDFPAQAVAAMLGLETDAVELACDRLAQHQQFLVLANPVEWADGNIGRGYRFIHDVYRRMLYNRLSPARRQQLHRRAAIAIESGYRGRESEVAAELALHFELGREPEPTIVYLQLAADQARQRAAAGEAVAYLNRALTQVATLPQNTENEARELELRLRLMRVLITAVAYTATEQQDNLQRALKLCEHLQDRPSEIQILALQCSATILRGDIPAADMIISRAREVGKHLTDPVLLSHEPLGAGASALVKGQLTLAEEQFGHSIDLLSDADLREPTRLFGHDPAVLSLGYSTISAWLLGKPDEARRRAQLALARSESIGFPQVLVIGLDVALSAEHFRGDVEAARPLAAALDACMARYCVEYPYSRPVAARNWLLLRSGDATAAIAGIRRGIDKAQAAGAGLFFPLMYITLAEACLATGAIADGLAAIDEALRIARGGERVLEAEAWRLKGELLRLAEDHEKAEQCFRTALAVAGEQSALSLELRAANSLVRLHNDTGLAVDAGEHLERVFGRFTEGFDTADLREARALCQTA